MDISTINNWIQAAIWITCAGIAIFKWVKSSQKMNTFGGGPLLFAIISLGILSSAFSWYRQLNTRFPPYVDGPPKIEVTDKFFQNEIVDMDGKYFRHCTFRNVKFHYNGTAPVSFEGNSLQGRNGLISENGAVNMAWVLEVGVGGSGMPVIGPDGKPLPNVTAPTFEKPQQTQTP